MREGDELRRLELLGAARARAAESRHRRRGPLPIGHACELERVRKRLPPVRERRLDDLLHAREVIWERGSPEGDERGIDVRRRPEDGPRDGVEADALGDELNEHRDRAVGLRPRTREEAVGYFALDHHAPEPERRQTVQALDDERRRDVVREVRDELGRRRRERGEVEPERVAEDEGHGWARFEPLAQVGFERTVELDRVDVTDPIGEVAREHAETRADLEHHVFGGELGEPADHAEDVLVDEEVLAEVAVRRDREPGHGSENAAAALASIRSASAAGSSPRASASPATVCMTY